MNLEFTSFFNDNHRLKTDDVMKRVVNSAGIKGY